MTCKISPEEVADTRPVTIGTMKPAMVIVKGVIGGSSDMFTEIVVLIVQCCLDIFVFGWFRFLLCAFLTWTG